MHRLWSLTILFVFLGVSPCPADPASPQVHTDRAHWFQVLLPEGWQVVPTAKGAAEVLVMRAATASTVSVTLQIRALSQLPELVTRDQLVEQAQAILRAVTVPRKPASTTVITGWPLTGLIADYADEATASTRVTVLLDPPRKRAFIWMATAAPGHFAQYDVAFDQLARGLVPTLPEG